MIDSALLSLTLRRHAADDATGLVGAALTSVTALSISAQRLARKNERARLEPAQKRETQRQRR